MTLPALGDSSRSRRLSLRPSPPNYQRLRTGMIGVGILTALSLNVTCNERIPLHPCALGGQQSAQSSTCSRAATRYSAQDTDTERRQETDGHHTDGRWDEMPSYWSSCTMRRALSQREHQSASSSSMCPCCDDVTQYGSPIQPSRSFRRHSFLLQRRDRLPAPFPLLQRHRQGAVRVHRRSYSWLKNKIWKPCLRLFSSGSSEYKCFFSFALGGQESAQSSICSRVDKRQTDTTLMIHRDEMGRDDKLHYFRAICPHPFLLENVMN